MNEKCSMRWLKNLVCPVHCSIVDVCSQISRLFWTETSKCCQEENFSDLRSHSLLYNKLMCMLAHLSVCHHVLCRYMFDEPSSYLDVKQRLKAARVIRGLCAVDKYPYRHAQPLTVHVDMWSLLSTIWPCWIIYQTMFVASTVCRLCAHVCVIIQF